MALLQNLPSELQAERRKLVSTFEAVMESEDSQEFFDARAAIDAFDEAHGINHEAQDIYDALVRNGWNPAPQESAWSVMEIHAEVMDRLNQDLDLDDTVLFGDLLALCNAPAGSVPPTEG